jgi:hypothetical protein
LNDITDSSITTTTTTTTTIMMVIVIGGGLPRKPFSLQALKIFPDASLFAFVFGHGGFGLGVRLEKPLCFFSYGHGFVRRFVRARLRKRLGCMCETSFALIRFV